MRKYIISFGIIANLLSFSQSHAESLYETAVIALNNSYSFKAKVEEFNANYAYKDMGMSYLLPSIDLSGNYGISKSKQDFKNSTTAKADSNTYGITLSLTQPLFSMSAWENYKKAQLYADQAQITLDSERNSILLQVVQLYFKILTSKEDLQFIDIQKQYLQEQMDETVQRVKVGQSKSVDIEEIKAKFELVKYQEILGQNTLQIAMENLNAFVSKDISEFISLKSDILTVNLPEVSLQKWKEHVSTSNLDLLLAKANLLLSENDVKLTKVGYYPTIALVASHAYTNLDIKDNKPLSNRQNSTSVGVNLSMNLYQGGLTNKQVKQAKAKHNAAIYSSKALESTIMTTLSSYYLNVYSGLVEIQALQQSMVSSEKFLQMARRSYQVGLKTNRDVLVATQEHFDSQRQLSQAKYNFLLSILSLKAVSGVLQLTDIEEINQYLG